MICLTLSNEGLNLVRIAWGRVVEVRIYTDTQVLVATLDRLAAAAREVYQLHGQPERLRVLHPDCEHDFPPEMRDEAYRLFDQVLKSPR